MFTVGLIHRAVTPHERFRRSPPLAISLILVLHERLYVTYRLVNFAACSHLYMPAERRSAVCDERAICRRHGKLAERASLRGEPTFRLKTGGHV